MKGIRKILAIYGAMAALIVVAWLLSASLVRAEYQAVIDKGKPVAFVETFSPTTGARGYWVTFQGTDGTQSKTLVAPEVYRALLAETR
jgi:hypothetical protein